MQNAGCRLASACESCLSALAWSNYAMLIRRVKREDRLDESKKAPWWIWIRWIPLKLHKAGPLIGGIIGCMLGRNVGKEDTYAMIGAIVGLCVGVPAAIAKEQARSIANDLWPPVDKTPRCRHCGASLEMKSFRLYLRRPTRCPECHEPVRGGD